MDTITTKKIIAAVKSSFGVDSLHNINEVLADWISDQQEIIAYSIDKRNDRLFIIAAEREYPENPPGKQGNTNYNLLRVFPGGNQWHVSVDVSEVGAERMMLEMLERIAN